MASNAGSGRGSALPVLCSNDRRGASYSLAIRTSKLAKGSPVSGLARGVRQVLCGGNGDGLVHAAPPGLRKIMRSLGGSGMTNAFSAVNMPPGRCAPLAMSGVPVAQLDRASPLRGRLEVRPLSGTPNISGTYRRSLLLGQFFIGHGGAVSLKESPVLNRSDGLFHAGQLKCLSSAPAGQPGGLRRSPCKLDPRFPSHRDLRARLNPPNTLPSASLDAASRSFTFIESTSSLWFSGQF